MLNPFEPTDHQILHDSQTLLVFEDPDVEVVGEHEDEPRYGVAPGR